MLMLTLGVILWSFAHLFKRLAPTVREGMGDGGKLGRYACAHRKHRPNDFRLSKCGRIHMVGSPAVLGAP
jgi:hypothetical protein